ncbi:unnamed protein product [Effrenium voratum]|nr:unnamed protein product [Effrenium voratum]CAJ1460195.1 unnamed protein product [Effrenium voratum]
MRCFAVALLLGRVAGDALEVTSDNWEEKVMKPVEAGKTAFVKFYAPWCGHCKKLKPDWDKLASKWNKADSNALIVDVDCTTDANKDMCGKYGVQGYPTLKYFGPSTSKDGDSYEDARDLKALNKFVKRTSKKPCAPDSGDNCDKKDNAYLEEIKDTPVEKLKEDRKKMQKEMDDLEAEYKAASDLFEKQKEEAMATMKKSEDLKLLGFWRSRYVRARAVRWDVSFCLL